MAYYSPDVYGIEPERRGRYTPIGGGRNPDGTTVNGGRPYSFNPVADPVRMGGGGNGGGLAAMLQPSGTWTTKTESTHPFSGLQDLLTSSILGRLMSQHGQEAAEIRGLQGGAVAWNHLEDPYGRVQTTTDTFRPPAVAPPRKRFGGMADQLESVFTKVLDENGYPVEAYPGPMIKNGRQSDGTPTQYRHGVTGAPIPNPYV
jgi:hypothetical protein